MTEKKIDEVAAAAIRALVPPEGLGGERDELAAVEDMARDVLGISDDRWAEALVVAGGRRREQRRAASDSGAFRQPAHAASRPAGGGK